VLAHLLSDLTREARLRGLNDSQWAEAAGLRKETLSRVRSRGSCDFASLEALARAVGVRLAALAASPVATDADGHFPAEVGREYEARLLALCASGSVDPEQWRGAGPAFFMAGLAVMLAGAQGFDRSRYLGLAEVLHPGISSTEVFALWLARSPVRPSRFLPLLRESLRRAA
jgi:hypothetical protein